MKVFLLTFCDFIIDRLYEHRARKGLRRLVVPEWFAYDYSQVLNQLGASVTTAKDFGKFLTFFREGTVEQDWEGMKQCFKFFRSLVEVLFDFDDKLSSSVFEESLVSGLKEILSWDGVNFVKHAKYVTVYPMARYLKNELPKKPDTFFGSPLLFHGSLRRYLKNRLVSHNKHCARLFLGYLQGVKRGAATVPDSYIETAMDDHKEAMRTPPSREGYWSTQPIIQEYAQEFFQDMGPSTPRLFEGSTSASYERPRGLGGARGKIFSYYTKEMVPYTGICNWDLPETSETDLIFQSEIRPGEIFESRARVAPVNLSDVRQNMLNRHKLDGGLNHDRQPQLYSKVSAVLEPLKVRLITKGETWHYYFSRFFQKDLWKYLQSYPQFVLTGRPLETSDLYDLIQREKDLDLNFGSKVFYVSGDYKAATDNLSIYYTKTVFEAALVRSKLSESDKDDLRKVIYEQIIVYPERDENGFLHSEQQMNGQLMGSTLSFPILCVVNLIAYWWALEEYLGCAIDARSLPVLINGDDIGFRANDLLYSIWLDKIKLVGFSLSLGKNYCSKRFFTINSKMFFCKETRDNIGVSFEEIGYLNIGLLQNSVVDRRSGALRPLWDNYNEVMKGAVNKIFAHRRFFHYNYLEINRLTNYGEFNLYISPILGGLGFHIYPEIRPFIQMTSFQRKLGTYIKNKLASGFTTNLPIGEFFSVQVSLSDSVIRNLSFKPATRYHVGTYKMYGTYGPLKENEREIVDRSTSTPFFMEIPVTEGPTMEVSFPTKRLLREFRSSCGWIHGRQIQSFDSLLSRPYRLIELKYDDKSFIPELFLSKFNEKELAKSMSDYSDDLNTDLVFNKTQPGQLNDSQGDRGNILEDPYDL